MLSRPTPKTGSIKLDAGVDADVIYLFGNQNRGYANYLQAASVGIPAESLEIPYRKAEPIYAESLAVEVAMRLQGTSNLAVVTPPSTRDDALPYLTEVCRGVTANDLSAGYGPKSGKKAVGGITVKEWISLNPYSCCGNESEIDHLVIVDDVIGTGTTASAIVDQMRTCGLNDTARVTIVAPIWTTNEAGVQ